MIVLKLRRNCIFIFTGQTNNHSRIPNADEVENFPPEGRPVPTNQFKVSQIKFVYQNFDEFLDNNTFDTHIYLDLILISHMQDQMLEAQSPIKRGLQSSVNIEQSVSTLFGDFTC